LKIIEETTESEPSEPDGQEKQKPLEIQQGHEESRGLSKTIRAERVGFEATLNVLG
jgi:hypothetical protein